MGGDYNVSRDSVTVGAVELGGNGIKMLADIEPSEGTPTLLLTMAPVSTVCPFQPIP